MVKKLAIAVAMVALMAVPSFAAVQNVKVGGDLKTTSVIRDNFNLGATAAKASQNVILSQVGLDVSADLTDNVSTVLRLTNERLWGTYDQNIFGSGTGGVNLDTAYVTMKDLMYAPLSVTIGRQPLQYGNQLIIGDGDLTHNGDSGAASLVKDLGMGVNFDAIKAVLSYDPLTVDLFAAKVSEVDVASPSVEDKGDTDLYGVNANYKFGDSMNSVVEAYTFVQMGKDTTAAATSKEQTTYVPGLRVSTNPIEGLNVQLEGAYEFGRSANGSLDNGATMSAYALQGMVNYALPVMKDMKPVLSLGDTYFSGDKTSGDNKNHAFNALYNNQEVGRIWSAIFSKSNLNVMNLAVSLDPIKDLTTKLSWYGLYQAKKAPVTLLAGSDYASTSSMTAKRSNRLGSEVDLDLTYAYTEDVSFGVSGGMLFGGTKISNGNSDIAKQLLTSVDVKF